MQHVVRLADGKGLMIAVEKRSRISKAWQGHLVREFVESDFARSFREELLERLGGAWWISVSCRLTWKFLVTRQP
jgi:hypothetical protein